MKKIQAIFFDFDGVILESVNVKGWAFGELFEGYPEHIDEIVAFHYANGGMSRFDKFQYIHKNILQRPLPAYEFERLCKKFSHLVYHRIVESDYVPGALEFIQKYADKILLYIISGTPQEEMVRIVEAKGLSTYFRGVFGSPVSKSAWAKTIIAEDNLDHGEVLFVGDAMSDYQAAVENGLVFAARIKSSQDDVFKGKAIDFRVADLFELDRLLTADFAQI